MIDGMLTSMAYQEPTYGSNSALSIFITKKKQKHQ